MSLKRSFMPKAPSQLWEISTAVFFLFCIITCAKLSHNVSKILWIKLKSGWGGLVHEKPPDAKSCTSSESCGGEGASAGGGVLCKGPPPPAPSRKPTLSRSRGKGCSSPSHNAGGSYKSSKSSRRPRQLCSPSSEKPQIIHHGEQRIKRNSNTIPLAKLREIWKYLGRKKIWTFMKRNKHLTSLYALSVYFVERLYVKLIKFS